VRQAAESEPVKSPTRLLPRPRHSLVRRIALIFGAAVTVTALALSLSAYFITAAASESEALNKAISQTRFNLFLADNMLPSAPTEADFRKLLDAFKIRGEFATLVETPDGSYVSGPDVTPSLVAPALRERVEAGKIAYQAIKFSGKPILIVGGLVRSPALAFYFFFPQAERLAELARLRNILIASGLVLAIVGALAGYLLARGLVFPLREASMAAVRMAQGDLNIRLPEGEDEFGVLASSFNRMAENLQARMRELEAGQARERRFVADVAHELRTPVAALVGEASLLRGKLQADPQACSPEIRQLAAMLTNDVNRLRQLVDDLLEISRLDAKAAETVLEPVEVVTFLKHLVRAHGWETLVTIAPARPQTVTAGKPRAIDDLPRDLVAWTDRRRLERIMVNLLDNALRHGAPPVVIAIDRFTPEAAAATLGSGGIRITVSDHGPGIPEEHLPHIFERFYKVDPSRAASRGSGLGLAIARENARLLGGELLAANLPQGGACFTLFVPTSAQEAVAG